MVQFQNFGDAVPLIAPLAMAQSQSQGLAGLPFLFDQDVFINRQSFGGGSSSSFPGPPGPPGPPGSPGLVPVTNVTTTPFNVVLGDYFLAVNVAGPASVVLPAAAPIGTVFVVKDTSGLAATNNITITATGSTIDGAANFVLATNYGSVTFVRTSTEWSVI